MNEVLFLFVTLHSLLSKYANRTNPKLEFFQISIEEIKIFFDLRRLPNYP